MFNHLISAKQLSRRDVLNLINIARAFRSGSSDASVADGIAGKAVVLMFLENSTRTKCSFELAAQNLGLRVLNFEASKSSFSKGETLVDTLANLYSIGVQAAVIRSGENGIFEHAASMLKFPMRFINAGEGDVSHPTQALLDLMTMLDKLGDVGGKKIAIIGDVKHSRVAKSNIALLSKFAADVHICAPSYFADDFDATWHEDLAEAIADADVVMALRVQNERHIGLNFSIDDYARDFGLTAEKLNKYAPNAILMHPGPVNRDIEISSELLDGPSGLTIFEQARNGTFIRMAVLSEVLK